MIPARDSRGGQMKRFVEGIDRGQSTLFPECLEDWICEDDPFRVIDAFVECRRLGHAAERPGGRAKSERVLICPRNAQEFRLSV